MSLSLPHLSENCRSSSGEGGGDVTAWRDWEGKAEAEGGNPVTVLPRCRAGWSEVRIWNQNVESEVRIWSQRLEYEPRQSHPPVDWAIIHIIHLNLPIL